MGNISSCWNTVPLPPWMTCLSFSARAAWPCKSCRCFRWRRMVVKWNLCQIQCQLAVLYWGCEMSFWEQKRKCPLDCLLQTWSAQAPRLPSTSLCPFTPQKEASLRCPVPFVQISRDGDVGQGHIQAGGWVPAQALALSVWSIHERLGILPRVGMTLLSWGVL